MKLRREWKRRALRAGATWTFCAGIMLVPVAGLAQSKAEPPRAGTDETATWFAQGTAAHEAGKFAEAEELFLKVWAVRKAWDVAANLGLAQVNLGKHVAAAEHLAYALRWFPASEPAATKSVLERRLTASRAEIGAVKITVNVPGAEVRIGGELKGTTPIESELFVAAGELTVEARKEGYASARQTVRVAKGGNAALSFALVKQAAPPAERSVVPAAIAFGVGGAGLVLGAIGGGVATAKFGEIKEMCGESLVCPESARGTYDAANAASYVSTAGFIAAGVGAAVGVTLLLLPARKQASARIGVSLGPGFFNVKGSF